MKKPTAEELNKIDLSEKIKMLNGHPDGRYFGLQAGREHYRLLHWFGFQHKTIFEFGTFRALSALALSSPVNAVYTYDVEEHEPAVWLYRLPSIKKYIYEGDLNNVLIDFDLPSLIFLDTVHDGIFEKQIIEHLIALKWKGILVADDIHWNNQMEHWWAGIEQRKEDWTDIGHWSGTGIIYFE